MAHSASTVSRAPASEPTPDPVPLLLREAADTLRRLPRGLARPRLSS
jgi:hypothetical protein